MRPLAKGERPWRLGSQLYVGFFGGALAVAAIAWENSRRVGAPRETQKWIVIVGALGVVASVIVSYMLYGNDFGSAARLGYRIVGVLTFGVLYKLQRSADRVYSFRSPSDHEHDYDSMWGAGLVAVLAGGLLQLGIVFGGMALIHSIAG